MIYMMIGDASVRHAVPSLKEGESKESSSSLVGGRLAFCDHSFVTYFCSIHHGVRLTTGS